MGNITPTASTPSSGVGGPVPITAAPEPLSVTATIIRDTLNAGLRSVDPTFTAQAIQGVLRPLNIDWALDGRWPSVDDMWAEIRPYLFDGEGISLKVVRRIENLAMRHDLGALNMATLAMRWAAVDWALAQADKARPSGNPT